MSLGISIAFDGMADEELSGASSVEVFEQVGQATTFRMTFPLSISEGDLPGLVDDRFDPGSDISILVPVEDTLHSLVKGPVHGQQAHLEHGGADSWLEVRGSDSSVAMDREVRTTEWVGSVSDAVNGILGDYEYTPDVDTNTAQHDSSKHSLIQRDSDLRFIRRLGRRSGHEFWVTADSEGVETAHFQRPVLDGSGDADLIINLADRNLDSFDITWDVERPTSVEASQLDLNAKTDIDGAVASTPQTVLGSTGLADITGDTRSVLVSAPADGLDDIQGRAEGAVMESDWFITANTETSLETLGKLAHTHAVVNVKGAGSRHSGKYFTRSVRHVIDSESHRMVIELVRNGWGE